VVQDEAETSSVATMDRQTSREGSRRCADDQFGGLPRGPPKVKGDQDWGRLGGRRRYGTAFLAAEGIPSLCESDALVAVGLESAAPVTFRIDVECRILGKIVPEQKALGVHVIRSQEQSARLSPGETPSCAFHSRLDISNSGELGCISNDRCALFARRLRLLNIWAHHHLIRY
jgi:hypothetical protein